MNKNSSAERAARGADRLTSDEAKWKLKFEPKPNESPKATTLAVKPVSAVEYEHHQYVDLVIGGGAMLGIAIAGYIHALEQAGIRFRAIAGTSSGAIAAALLMAIGPPSEKKGITLAAILANMPINQFLGFGPTRLIFWLYSKKWLRCVAIIALVLWSPKILFFHYLVNGDKFENWLRKTLDELDNANAAKGDDGRSECWATNWERKAGKISGKLKPKLTVIAADITRERKIEFPADENDFIKDPPDSDKDSADHGKDPPNPRLARYVRASTSVPIAFKPVKMRLDGDAVNEFEIKTLFGKKKLKTVKLVDGGLMSNFPIATFHDPDGGVPDMPTFGVKFDTKIDRPNKTFWIWQYLTALVKTGLDVADDEFIDQHPDYSKLVTPIDTNGISQLNVYMPPDEKLKLFRLGVEAGTTFIGEFNWSEYVAIRAEVAPKNAGANSGTEQGDSND